MIHFDVDKTPNKGIITGDEFAAIRERFSVENPAAKFSRFNRRIPFRKYLITQAGRFDIGLYYDIVKYIKTAYNDVKIIKTDEFKQQIRPIKKAKPTDLKLDLRDYQSKIVNTCITLGRGVVVLATAGGKTLTMASLIQAYYNMSNKQQFTCMVLVPDIGLVNQTNSDFQEYGVTFSHCKWTGDSTLNLQCNVIVCNMGILQSKKSDLSFLSHVDLLIVDEVHKLRSGNKINKILDKITTTSRFGFTGTMPENMEDQWNVIGKMGPILYTKNSYELREEKYIVKARVLILKLMYKDYQPDFNYDVNHNPLKRYKKELDFLQTSKFRNTVIEKLCNKFNNNALLLVEYIDHGSLLYANLSTKLKDKQVYFIRGDVEVSEREKIRKLMENSNNVVCIAISKIFSTGVNIKNLHYIMFCSGGKAKVKIIQSIGRGLRQHESKNMLTIVDLADQLQYGKQHMKKRTQLYDEENFNYEYRTIEEKTTTSQSA